jgi:glycosyltransferase involved in cell wall biosynthesis
MKICFVAPGAIPIPVDGWGALETVVWNQATQLEKMGYEISIINESTAEKTLESILQINPDIVHLHYGCHYEIMPNINCRKIITNHDGSFLASIKFHESIVRKYLYDCEFFILTSWEKYFLTKIGISPKKIKILPNGVDCESFKYVSNPKFPSKSICLGKIDQRKNQAFLQSLNCGIDFIGQNSCKIFDPSKTDYLGSWNRSQVFNSLTDYNNLVLLSELELQPLVCLEALSAGLGLVISSAASQNLDASLPFITVVEQDLIKQPDVVSQAIYNNRDICLHIGREKIREYAKKFDWNNLIQKYISNLL